MPYIRQSSRPKFETVIKDATSLIGGANVPQTSKVEYFGFFIDVLARRYVQVTGAPNSSFNAYLFPDATRKQLIEVAGKVATLIGSGDPMEASGELNYAISSILWALSDNANYGLRVFLSGTIRKVLNDLAFASANTSSDPKEKVMTSRRYIIALGVLNDVLDETYRRKTAPFEDQKIDTNGDI